MNDWLAVIPHYVLSDRKLSHIAKVVYAAVSSFTANATKEAYPGHIQIAERAGMPVRSVARPLSVLALAGYIKVHRRGRRLTNTYRVITLDSDITEACNHQPALSDDASERTPSIKRTLKRNSTPSQDETDTLFAFYAENVRRGPKPETLRSINKLLTQYSFEELMGAVKAYAQTHEAQGEMRFRYKPNNFFGKSEYFKEYLPVEPDTECNAPPPKELTPEEEKIRQRLKDAGQA